MVLLSRQVTATLWLCSVPMAALFGLLSFLLNFVPNLGSMIAVALPLPLVMVEPSMQPYEKVRSAHPATFCALGSTIGHAILSVRKFRAEA